MATLGERPYVEFNFLVDLGHGIPEGPNAGFQELSGIGMEVTVRESTGNHKKQRDEDHEPELDSELAQRLSSGRRNVAQCAGCRDDAALRPIPVVHGSRDGVCATLSTDLREHRILRTSPPVAGQGVLTRFKNPPATLVPGVRRIANQLGNNGLGSLLLAHSSNCKL